MYSTESLEVTVSGVTCIAREAHFGGIVIEPKRTEHMEKEIQLLRLTCSWSRSLQSLGHVALGFVLLPQNVPSRKCRSAKC